MRGRGCVRRTARTKNLLECTDGLQERHYHGNVVTCTPYTCLSSVAADLQSTEILRLIRWKEYELLPDPRVRASVASRRAHITGSLTVSRTKSTASWLLNLSHRPSLASTKKASSLVTRVKETSASAVSPLPFKSASPNDLRGSASLDQTLSLHTSCSDQSIKQLMQAAIRTPASV